MTEMSRALDFLSLAVPGVGSNPDGDIEFHFAFLLPSSCWQFGEAGSNAIKHGVHKE